MSVATPAPAPARIPFAFALPDSPPVCNRCGQVQTLWVYLQWGAGGAYGTACRNDLDHLVGKVLLLAEWSGTGWVPA